MNDGKIDCECCHSNGNMTKRTEELKRILNSRLNRIAGQVQGIKGLIEKDVYCDDILNQISAASAALSSVSRLILEQHLKNCVADKIRNGDDEVIDELLKTLKKMF